MSIPVNYRETLVTYLNAEDISTAARNLGISRSVLQSRLHTLKKAGVNVPKKGPRKGISKLEVAQLNSIVKKYQKENE